MTYNNHNQYLQNQILTASPEQLLLMLYDGAIRFTRQAIQGLAEGKLGDFHHGIQKAMAIISEFSQTLNHEMGGEIAENLDALYGFMIRELTLANLHKDNGKLQVVEKILVDLRATWGEAVEINRKAMPESEMAGRIARQREQAVPENYVPLSISR